MAKKTFRISGRVIDAETGDGIAGLKVEAWDKDLLFDDLVGSTETDSEGVFELSFDESYFSEIFLDRQPDLFFKVFYQGRLIKSTEDSVLWNVAQPDVRVAIPLSGVELPPSANNDLFRVEGQVTTEDGRAVVDVIVEAWDQRLGSEKMLASAVTDRRGRYLVTYDPTSLDGKGRADLVVRVFDRSRQRIEIARSDVIYQADPVTVVDLIVIAAQVNRPSEYDRLLAATRPLVEQKPLEDLDADGVMFVASRSGWDARMIAMAAEAERMSGATEIPAAHYYVLLRSGLSAETIHQLPGSSVKRALETATANNLIADDEPIDTTLQLYRQQSLPALQEFTSAAAVSTLGEMLDLSLDDNQKHLFLEHYQATAGQPDELWSALGEAGFDESLIERLKTDGKLGFLTRQNAPLVGRLVKDAEITRIEDLPRAGLYKADAWKDLIGDDLPPQLGIDEYATGLAVQVNLAYPTLVIAEMLRRREIAVDDQGRDGEGEIASFLRASREQHTLGLEPIKNWTGYQQLSPRGRENARLVERLYQMSPSNEAMVALANLGLHSAYQITREPEAQFLLKYGGEFPDQRQAQLVYRKAQQVHSTTLNLATLYLNYRATPNVYALTGSTQRQQSDFSDVPGAPTLEELLGNMDYCACEHCKSVLSPAAYYVELLNFIDVADVPPGTRNPIKVLFERRPDLEHLLLSCENTNIVLPYIDLVNEILEYYVVNGSLRPVVNGNPLFFTGYNMRADSNSADLMADPQFVQAGAYDITRAEVYPRSLPFDMPLEALRLFMQAWDTTLPAALRLFGSAAAARRETLGLNATEYSILTDITFRELPEYFGEPAAATVEQLNASVAEGKTFCRRTEISYEDLVDLLKTGYINPGALLVPRLEALQVSLQQLQSWYDGVIDDAGLEALFPLDIETTDYDGDILQWLRDNQSLLMGLITLTDVSPEPVDCDFATLELRFALPDMANNQLTAIAYHKLLRFIRLWKKLGWSIDLTDRVIATFLGMPSRELSVGNIDAAFITLLARMANFIWLANRLSVSAKNLGDWLPVWDMSQTHAVRRQRLAHLLRFGITDLEQLFEITGIDPVADDMDTDAPSLHRFLDARDALKTTKLKVTDINFLLRHQDDAGKLAPGEASLRLDLKALRDALTAVETELSVPPETADLDYARNKMALVYDTTIVDWFISLVSASKTYDTPFATTEEALPEKLTAEDGRIGFDPFTKLLTYIGVMTEDARLALANAADSLLLADMEVITDQVDLDAYISAFKAAAQALADTGAADVQALAEEYSELQAVYDAVVATPDPESQALALVEQILPALRQRLKTVALRTTLAAQLKIDPPLIDVLTEGAAVLHAYSDSGKAILDDFLALETPVVFDADQVYALHLDPPATDDYILYARAPAGTSVTLSIDGVDVIPATLVDADGEVSTSAPVSLQSGVLTAVTLTLSGLPSNASAELYWRTRAMAKEKVPDSRLYTDPQLAEARASLIRLQKAALLLKAMPITPRELRYLATVDANTNGYLNDLDIDGTISDNKLHSLWRKFAWLAWFFTLKAHEPDQNTRVSLLENPAQTTAQGSLVLAGANAWNEQDLVDTLAHFGLVINDVSSLDVLRKIKEALDFISGTTQPASDILAWAVDAPDLAMIDEIKDKLRERQNEQAWRMTLQNVNDALRNRRRDALVSYILHHASPAPEIDTPDKLYEHFLIDVGMDACRKTSRIRQALSTTQLFISRCLMNLESEVDASSVRADHWAWMKRYRVWEANRKIFLWPENWLEPELRDNKSPIFRELESELLKSDITDELAESAYLAYLKKLDEIARLEIMGSFLQEQTADQDDDILHVFGRTNGNAHQYYYRRYEHGYWTPWEKVGLNIQGDLLLPVIWKSQLFVFWLTAVPRPDAGDRSQTPAAMADKAWGDNSLLNVELQLSWGEYYDGKWVSPKSSDLLGPNPVLLTGLDKFESEKITLSGRTEKPRSDMSERLIISLGYLGTYTWFHLTFTSKNAPPLINEKADMALLENPVLFNWILFQAWQTNTIPISNAHMYSGKEFKVTIRQPSGALSSSLDEKIMTKTNLLYDAFRVMPVMHPVTNQWEAPFFYSDEHSVFFASSDERARFDPGGFYWNESDAVLVSPDRIEIPELYEKPVIKDPAGPIINPHYEQVINDNSVFVYRGTAFDANGVVTEEVGQ